jgi:hypothetical protein
MPEFVQCGISKFILSARKMAVIFIVALTAKMRKGKVAYLGEGILRFRKPLDSAPFVLLIKSRVHLKALEW